MGSAVALGDVVGVAEHVFLVAVVPLQRRLHGDVVFHRREMEGGRMHRGLVPVQVLDEGVDPALVMKGVLSLVPLIDQVDANARVQE